MAMDNVAMNVPKPYYDENYQHINTFLEMCSENNRPDYFECLIKNHARFGFKPIHKFDPLFKFQTVNLLDFIDSNSNELECYEKCLKNTEVSSSVEIFVSLKNRKIDFN